MTYDHITDLDTLSPDEYDTFVDWLKQSTAESLRAARGTPQQIRDTIGTYLAQCAKFNITPGEYTDFFHVDSPSILDLAGYESPDSDEAVKLFDAAAATR